MWQFTGGNSSTNGIPARDLTDDEWNAIPQWLRDIAVSRGHYQNITATVPVDVEVVVTEPAPEPTPEPIAEPDAVEPPKTGQKRKPLK